MLMMAGCERGRLCATSVAATSGTRPATTTLRDDMGPPGGDPPLTGAPAPAPGALTTCRRNRIDGRAASGSRREHGVHMYARRVQDRQRTVGIGDRHRKVRAAEDHCL